MDQQKHLRRLASEHYRGDAMVHWTLSMHGRATGWLNQLLHLRFREILMHTGCRYGLCCPVYCLMPDHMHMIWLGKTMDADQLLAMRFFRRHMQLVLSPYQFQKQAYDHVLRKEDRTRDAFRSICFYVLENPVRAGLVNSAEAWAYSGCLMVGLPDLHPLDVRFERVFWQQYADEVRRSMLSPSV